MSLIASIHSSCIHGRRVQRLADHLVTLIPPNVSVLDVGCGDGLLDTIVLKRRPDISIEGIDVLVRPDAKIPVRHFDGQTLPYADKSMDAVVLIDVLHHTEDPMVLLREVTRVARKAVVIKDHTRDGLFAQSTLRLMDYVGNAHHGVALPYNYWPRRRWEAAFKELGLTVSEWRTHLGVYTPPVSWIVGRRLHFMARLTL
jgi:SAM-dependent methyltransferase